MKDLHTPSAPAPASSAPAPASSAPDAFSPEKVKNIIFDLGGVVIDLRRENAVKALQEIGLKDADSMLGLYRQEQPFLGLETGMLTTAEFYEIIRSACGGDVSDIRITDAFNRFLIDIPESRLARLRRLREKGYRLFVLSNTNPVMYNSRIAKLFRKEGLSINDYFDGIVASFEELTCKPDPAIFSTVVRRYGLDPKETLMLDDSSANCEAARSVGLMALQVGSDSKTDMLALTEQFL